MSSTIAARLRESGQPFEPAFDMPQVPGLPPMDPILGQLIEQQQNFYVTLDPTITGSTAFSTLAAAPTSLFIGTGLAVHAYLHGVLMRAVL